MENLINSDILKEIESRVGANRYAHILRVVKYADKLAKVYHIDSKKAKIAALLHDCAKCKKHSDIILLANQVGFEISSELMQVPQVIHAHLGAYIAKEVYGIEDEEILMAIKYHTTGRKGMTDLEKIIYLADYLEEGRVFPEVEFLREKSLIDLDETLFLAVENSIKFLLEKKKKIAFETISLWNERK